MSNKLFMSMLAKLGCVKLALHGVKLTLSDTERLRASLRHNVKDVLNRKPRVGPQTLSVPFPCIKLGHFLRGGRHKTAFGNRLND